MKLKIESCIIGDDEPCFIIADVGANHDRKLSQARQLIDIAAEAGVDAVKFQTYSADTLYSTKTPVFPGEQIKPHEVTKRVELVREWQGELAEYARSQNLIFLSTPFDYKAIDELAALEVPAYKWASSEITDLPMLQYAAAMKKPIIISTGMSDLTDIQEAVTAIRSTGNQNIALLHCTSLYPTVPQQVNLKMMDTVRNAFHLPTGFSDHSLGINIAIAAVARGANILEKHFTIDRTLDGPDHAFALEKHELVALVKATREVEESLGSPIKLPISEELEKRELSRRSIIAAVDIKKSTKITREMLITKRPGFGIPPKFLELIVGRCSKTDIEKDGIIDWDMIC